MFVQEKVTRVVESGTEYFIFMGKEGISKLIQILCHSFLSY